jgi:hypothetical protein
MITLKANDFDITNITSELDLKISGVKELQSPMVLNALADAVFTLSAKAFVKAMNLQAKAFPKQYHHVYEWNKTGTESGRLFFLFRENSNDGVLVVKPGFIKSRTKVPVSPELLLPGKTGKVVASRHIFYDKAKVMEAGTPVIYRASKNIPLPENGVLRFVAAGTLIKNYNPGGKEVKGSFEKFFKTWYATKVQSVVSSSGIVNSIDTELAKVLNKNGAGAPEVGKAMVNLLRQYSKNEAVV